MTIRNTIGNLLINAGYKLSGDNNMTGTLKNITDDPRIGIDSREYTRIKRDIKYYTDSWDDVWYRNSFGTRLKRKQFTLNMTKVASRKLASIIFNEKCEIHIGSLSAKNDDRDGTSTDQSEQRAAKLDEYLQQVFLKNDFKDHYEERLEEAIALGTMTIKPYVDPVSGDIKFAWCRADQTYPLESNTNSVRDICIASRTVRSEANVPIYYTLLEFHQWQGEDYVITNELYRSPVKSSVGTPVSLSAIPEYADIQPTVTIENLKYPLFAFFKTSGANNKSLESPLGVGIPDNSLSTLRAINDTYDTFHWEILTGRRKIAVPPEMFRKPQGDKIHNANSFEHDISDVYLAIPGNRESVQPTEFNPDLRVDDFSNAINEYMRKFEMEIGFSANTFSYQSGNSQVTATQVISENSNTYQTRSSYCTMVENNIDALVKAILELSMVPELFPNHQAPLKAEDVDFDDLDISVSFDDGVFVDKQSRATYWQGLLASSVVPRWMAIKNILEVPESVARDLADEIATETAQQASNTTPDISDLLGNHSSSE
ncbi:phage portal protein [Lactiplantibacillus fabifermentans]|uniref:phage portal protein n=1 Tax=Lactiplantibacillus fabifermentans TaxID=483011 RepID=UPI0004641EBD|nr:phage portal protein [Lactiplantibacillus fabifermentans]